MTTVHGTWDPKFKELPKLLQSFIDSGEELGASLCVNIRGDTIIDIWGGFADTERTRLWEQDTITNVFSTTKAITALAALVLIERKLLDVNAKVCKYWPEFAANGKGDVLVRHILSHSSGLSGWDHQMSFEDICDFDVASARLAAQTPWWTPGTASGYHAWTFGHLVGSIVRRVTSKSLKAFIAEELSGPLDSDFQLGALEKDWPRISNVVPPPPSASPPPTFEAGSVVAKTMINPVPVLPFVWSPTWRYAEVGSANGHGNARAVVRLLAPIASPEKFRVQGKPLLSPETIDLIFTEQIRGIDLVAGFPMRFGIGFGLVGDGDTYGDSWLPRGRVCFWGGWGGSLAIVDVDRQVTISYVMNKMSDVGIGNVAGKTYVKAIYEALGVDIA